PSRSPRSMSGSPGRPGAPGTDAAARARPQHRGRPQARATHRMPRHDQCLTERKSLEGFDWAFQPSLDKALILELACLDFVRRRDDLVITGDNGTGKSHILKAFALRACEQGIRVLYARCVDLHAGFADGTYARRLKRWARADLLLVNDVG